MADNISLIWRILDFAAIQQSNAPIGQSLFQPSLEADLQPRAACPEQMDLQDPEVESPPDDFQTSLGDYAAAPDWFSPPVVPLVPLVASTSLRQDGGYEQSLGNTSFVVAATTMNVETAQNLDELSSWTIWGTTHPNEATDAMIYDPFAQLFSSCSGPDYSRWWDGGNL